MAQKAKALTTAQMVEMWTRTAGAAETSLADLAKSVISDFELTKSDLPFLSRPKGEAKQNNRHVDVFDGIERLLQENIVVKGVRVMPETWRALRDKNVAGETLLQGIPKSSSTTTAWNGQISSRFGQLRKAITALLETGGTTAATTDSTDLKFMTDRMQAMYNRANKAEAFDLADLAAFNAGLTNLAKMCGITLKAVS